jgi:hypothetical protein
VPITIRRWNLCEQTREQRRRPFPCSAFLQFAPMDSRGERAPRRLAPIGLIASVVVHGADDTTEAAA